MGAQIPEGRSVMQAIFFKIGDSLFCDSIRVTPKLFEINLPIRFDHRGEVRHGQRLDSDGRYTILFTFHDRRTCATKRI
jgi:hypothetical protein